MSVQSHCKTVLITLLLSTALAQSAGVVKPAFADPPGAQAAEADGLVRVRSQRFDAAYIAPGADFRTYTAVMIDPAEASLQRTWLRDYNRQAVNTSARISEDDARAMLQTIGSGFQDIFTQAYRQAGYQITTTPGPNVLRLKTIISNIEVNAPDVMTAGRSATFSREAGEATLTVEARDSMSGAILARGIDRRTLGDAGRIQWRTSVSNRSDFERAFRVWAQKSVEASNALRTMSPSAAAPAG